MVDSRACPAQARKMASPRASDIMKLGSPVPGSPLGGDAAGLVKTPRDFAVAMSRPSPVVPMRTRTVPLADYRTAIRYSPLSGTRDLSSLHGYDTCIGGKRIDHGEHHKLAGLHWRLAPQRRLGGHGGVHAPDPVRRGA